MPAGNIGTIFRVCVSFFKKMFLFFQLRRVLVAAHGIFVEACGIFSSRHTVCSSFSLVVASGFSLLQLWLSGSRAPALCSLWHVSSTVGARGLSCPAACGIPFPRPGIKPASPALEGGLSTTGPPGKSPVRFILERCISTLEMVKI